jgi:asparagine synthetase B (glutamine-hydrolysing)
MVQARRTLLRTARQLGFHQVFDGEGSDELFDIGWSAIDLVRETGWRGAIRTLASSGQRRRSVRDLLASGRLGIGSRLWLSQQASHLAHRHPWLRREFWRSDAFCSAWDETRSYWQRDGIRARLPEIVGANSRNWRTLSLLAEAEGVEEQSPFWDRCLVELAGSLSARAAIDPRHRKPLIRRLARERAPNLDGGRAKQDPLHDWLAELVVHDDAYFRRTLERIKQSDVLTAWIDDDTLPAIVRRARERNDRARTSDLVQLFALVEWVDLTTRSVGQRPLET